MFPPTQNILQPVGQGGPRTIQDGTYNSLRMEKSGAQVIQTAHGWYNEAVYRGNVFLGANQAAQTLTSIGTTSQTGLILVNPPGSGKNLVLLQVEFALTGAGNNNPTVVLALQTAASASLASPANTAKNALVGNAATCVGLVTTSATLQSNPVVAKVLQVCNTTTLPATVNPPVTYDIGGIIMLTPGTAACISSIATTATGFASFTWEEIPV